MFQTNPSCMNFSVLPCRSCFHISMFCRFVMILKQGAFGTCHWDLPRCVAHGGRCSLLRPLVGIPFISILYIMNCTKNHPRRLDWFSLLDLFAMNSRYWLWGWPKCPPRRGCGTQGLPWRGAGEFCWAKSNLWVAVMSETIYIEHWKSNWVCKRNLFIV